MAEEQAIRLQADDMLVEIAPHAGGSITRFAHRYEGRSVELMRVAPARAVDNAHSLSMACFPLFPYSGRIRDARFEFRGERILEQKNFPPSTHAIHGHAWQAPWRVADKDASDLTLCYDHTPGSWPFSYRATQRFTLSPQTLDVALCLRNTSPRAMPAGLGLHPYFPRTAQATVSAGVTGVWFADDEVLPTEHVQVPAAWPIASGLHVASTVLDNIFTGWCRQATITWPESGVALSMVASEPLDFLVVYTPAGEDFFCVEPVSHCADAFNLANAGTTTTGMVVLEPEMELNATVRFSVQRLSARPQSLA